MISRETGLACDMAIMLAEDIKEYSEQIRLLRAAVTLARDHLIVNDIALPNVQEVLDDALALTSPKWGRHA